MGTCRLFDASALVDIAIDEGGEDVGLAVVFDEYLLALTMYEAANALRKIATAPRSPIG